MDDFTIALLKSIDTVEKQYQIRQPKLRSSVEKYGGISAVKEYLRKNRTSDGFDQLMQAGKLQYSMEALAIESKWNSLFTDDEVNLCFEVLCGADYFTRKGK